MIRFWQKVRVAGPDDCWNWMAGADKFGYGRFLFDGKNRHAHRISWILTHGEITNGLCVLHKCDNPACVNPSHLWLGTVAENNLDCLKKGRNKQPKWSKNGMAKLNEGQAREVKRRCLSGELRYKVAREFNISAVAASYIAIGKNWKGLEV